MPFHCTFQKNGAMRITVKVYQVLGNLEGMGQLWAFNGQEELLEQR
jgi:hypothetical protein